MLNGGMRDRRWLRHKYVPLFLLLWFCAGYFNHNQGWNENSRFGLTFALVEHQELSIDRYHDQPALATGDKSLYQGHYYSDKAIGTSLFGAVVYWPVHAINTFTGNRISIFTLKWLITWLTLGSLFALCGTLLYAICCDHLANPWHSIAITLGVMLGTLAYPYSMVFMGHQVVGTLVLLSFFLIYRGKQRQRFSYRRLMAVGALLGFAVITEYTAILLAGVILIYGAYYVVQLSEPKILPRMLALLTLMGLPILLHIGYNLLAFGRLFSIGYANLDHPLFQAGVQQGILGITWPRLSVLYYLTLHPAYGIFWQSPILLLVPFGMYAMLRLQRYRSEALVILGIGASYLGMNAGYFYWWGGWSVGPRYLIPIMPFLGLALIFLPRRLRRWLWLPGLLSIGQMLLVASSTIHVPDTAIPALGSRSFFAFSSLYSYCWSQLSHGQFAPNLGNQLGLQGWASLLPGLAVGLAGCYAVWRWQSPQPGATAPSAPIK